MLKMGLKHFVRWMWYSTVERWLTFCLRKRRQRLFRSFVEELQKEGFTYEEIQALARGLDWEDDF